MTFGEGGMWTNIGGLQQADADTLVGRALDAGINFIDTADIYADGTSEIMTGQALKNLKVPRENVVVASKIHGETGTKGINSRGASRYHIIDGVKASLKRLQLDHIDLYQLHGFDTATPIEEALRALDNLVQHGHVRYIGVSNWAAWQIAKALGISERLGLARFESLQAYYTIAGRDLEREIVPMLKSENLGLMVWSPLAGGLLSGKYKRDGSTTEPGRRTNFSFPPVDMDQRVRLHRRHDSDGRSQGRDRGANRTRVAAAPEGGDERDYWGEADRATRRQHCSDASEAE